jgi:uncharacterized membrane protein YwzB
MDAKLLRRFKKKKGVIQSFFLFDLVCACVGVFVSNNLLRSLRVSPAGSMCVTRQKKEKIATTAMYGG